MSSKNNYGISPNFKFLFKPNDIPISQSKYKICIVCNWQFPIEVINFFLLQKYKIIKDDLYELINTTHITENDFTPICDWCKVHTENINKNNIGPIRIPKVIPINPCTICYDNPDDYHSNQGASICLECAHKFCGDCTPKLDTNFCPYCRTTFINNIDDIINRLQFLIHNKPSQLYTNLLNFYKSK